jgi:hypothetical protein
MLHKDYDHKGSVEKEIAGRESQASWHHDERLAVNRLS